MAKEKITGKNDLNKAQTLMDRIIKNSTIKDISMLEDSQVLKETKPIKTRVPVLNLALSGRLKGGLVPGNIISIAGESRNYKSSLGILCVAEFLKASEENIAIFLDSEFGTRPNYFESVGCDTKRIIHIPFTNINELKKELSNILFNQIYEIEYGKVLIFCDSIGSSASLQEVNTSLDPNKDSADLTRSREIKSLYRIITPIIALKKVIFIGINHVYSSLSFIPTTTMSGGSGGILSSSVIIFMSKSKLKEESEHRGYFFNMKIYKSRDIRDNVVIPLTVRFNGGIANYSGCTELAEAFKIIEKCREGRKLAYSYTTLNNQVLKVLETDIDTDENFWETIFKETDFEYKIEDFYRLNGSQNKNNSLDEETSNTIDVVTQDED